MLHKKNHKQTSKQSSHQLLDVDFQRNLVCNELEIYPLQFPMLKRVRGDIKMEELTYKNF